MDFKQGSKVALLLQLNAFHSLVVGDPAAWVFSPPVALTGDPDGKNTKVKLTALVPNTTYKGKRTFRYSRIDLASIQVNWPNPVRQKLTGATSTYQAFDYIRKYLGVLFDASDVEDLPIVDNGDGTLTVTLKAKPESLMWTGQVNITTADLPPISGAITPASFSWS